MTIYVIPSPNHGSSLKPLGVVVHSAETPLKRGFALSIGRWFATAGSSASAHAMVDPGDTVHMVDGNVRAWHAGPTANRLFKGYEQAGYASFTREQWLSPDGLAMISQLADLIAADCKEFGIPARWATDAQIIAARDQGIPCGLLKHDDVRRLLGGTTHHDPGPEYPYDVLLAMVQERLNGDDMPLNDADKQFIRDAVDLGLQQRMEDVTRAYLNERIAADVAAGARLFIVAVRGAEFGPDTKNALFALGVGHCVHIRPDEIGAINDSKPIDLGVWSYASVKLWAQHFGLPEPVLRHNAPGLPPVKP